MFLFRNVIMKRSFVITIAAAAALGVSACAADNSGQQNNTEKTTAAAAAPGASRQSSAVTSGKKTMNEKTGSLRVERGSTASYKKVSNNWFSFSMPAAWNAGTNEDEDNEYKVYEAKIFIPKSGVKMQSYIYVSYFAEDNEDIATYQEFIRVNSQNILRKAPVEWEKYEPVTETKIAGRKAYVVARNCRHFLNPNSKDDSYVMKKEKMYVLPASKGYYVIRYGAEENFFNLNIDTFEKIASSFKGKF